MISFAKAKLSKFLKTCITSMLEKKTEPAIGIFDSGVGGLTVMKEIAALLPHENIVYFGDTARVPYGEKSQETIVRYTIDSALFLMEQNIKLLVIACHTASSYALEKLRKLFNIPVLGVIEPSVKKAVLATRNQRIAVLGTKGTVRSGVYQNEIRKRLPNAFVLATACPLLVPLIEEKLMDHQATKLIIQEYLKPVLEQQIDTLLLACTHYPLLKTQIEDIAGDQITIIDPAQACAEEIRLVIDIKQNAISHAFPPDHRWFVSDDPEKFRVIGSSFLGHSLHCVEKASLFSAGF